MKKRILTAGIAVLLAVTAIAALTVLSDDDPVQYATITQNASPPVDAELHLWGSVDGGAFTDLGIPLIDSQFVLYAQNTTPTSWSNDTLFLQVADPSSYTFQLYTQYSLFVSDLGSWIYGTPGDTIQVDVVGVTLPAGESLTVTVDK